FFLRFLSAKVDDGLRQYPDLVALVAATDDYRSLTVQGIQKKIISIASMLAPNCSGSGYDSFKGDTLKIVRA
ncbi:MAG: hypothetical protein RR876_17310, partial [Acinetobacter sp.]|uniref:hypothetical protein n=1 Tax=Acinetobacter sp. TaxID=472 RepID=UPI002FCCB4B8